MLIFSISNTGGWNMIGTLVEISDPRVVFESHINIIQGLKFKS